MHTAIIIKVYYPHAVIINKVPLTNKQSLEVKYLLPTNSHKLEMKTSYS